MSKQQASRTASQMADSSTNASSAWKPLPGLHVNKISEDKGRLIVSTEVVDTTAKCPACGYGKLATAPGFPQVQDFADVPVDGQQVVIRVRLKQTKCTWCDAMGIQTLAWANDGAADGRRETKRLAEHRTAASGLVRCAGPAAFFLHTAPPPAPEPAVINEPSPPLPHSASVVEDEAEAFGRRLLGIGSPTPTPHASPAFVRSRSSRVVEVSHKPPRRKLSLDRHL